MAGILSHSLRHITLTELQQGIKATLSRSWGGWLWVIAEINDLKVNVSGHCYLELVDRPEGEESPTATMKGVIWANDAGRVISRFEADAGMELQAGMRVLMYARVSYHEVYGISLYVKDIDPEYTVGQMQRQRNLTIERLRQEGLYELNGSLEAPLVMQRVAVVSSDKAAGYRDFMRELESNEYGYRFDVTLFGAVMQGAGAEASVMAALEQIELRSDSFDAVVIIRGGGSVTDLSCFDGYSLAAAVARMSLPVVAGIGHDKDISVVDMVAFRSVKTPTAAARFFIDQMRRFDEGLESAAEFLGMTMRDAIEREREHIDLLSHSLRRKTDESIAMQMRLLDRAEVMLQRDSVRYIDDRLKVVSVMLGDVGLLWRRGCDVCQQALTTAEERLKTAAYRRLDDADAYMERIAGGVEAFEPRRIFALGYGMVRRGGRSLRSVDDASVGDNVEVALADGVLHAVVDKVSKNIMQ